VSGTAPAVSGGMDVAGSMPSVEGANTAVVVTTRKMRWYPRETGQRVHRLDACPAPV